MLKSTKEEASSEGFIVIISIIYIYVDKADAIVIFSFSAFLFSLYLFLKDFHQQHLKESIITQTKTSLSGFLFIFYFLQQTI